jgi:hypothetical protein
MSGARHEQQQDSWSAIARVVGDSAARRLGKPLLIVYAVLFAIGVVVVVGSLAWMWMAR